MLIANRLELLRKMAQQPLAPIPMIPGANSAGKATAWNNTLKTAPKLPTASVIRPPLAPSPREPVTTGRTWDAYHLSTEEAAPHSPGSAEEPAMTQTAKQSSAPAVSAEAFHHLQKMAGPWTSLKNLVRSYTPSKPSLSQLKTPAIALGGTAVGAGLNHLLSGSSAPPAVPAAVDASPEVPVAVAAAPATAAPAPGQNLSPQIEALTGEVKRLISQDATRTAEAAAQKKQIEEQKKQLEDTSPWSSYAPYLAAAGGLAAGAGAYYLHDNAGGIKDRMQSKVKSKLRDWGREDDDEEDDDVHPSSKMRKASTYQTGQEKLMNLFQRLGKAAAYARVKAAGNLDMPQDKDPYPDVPLDNKLDKEHELFDRNSPRSRDNSASIDQLSELEQLEELRKIKELPAVADVSGLRDSRAVEPYGPSPLAQDLSFTAPPPPPPAKTTPWYSDPVTLGALGLGAGGLGLGAYALSRSSKKKRNDDDEDE